VAESDPREEFRQLFEKSRRDLLAQAYLLTGDRQEAQDLVQEVFLRAWRTWTHLATVKNQRAWLRRVLYNLAVGRWRGLRLRRGLLNGLPPLVSTPVPEAERLDIVRALQSLPSRQRQALVLVAIFDLTTADAAREMGANEGSVRVWVSRARAKLEPLLGPDYAQTIGGVESDE
jgi:RNA polymerase sigma-70 factor (ECF subfamily)